jgi:hypothetical protein
METDTNGTEHDLSRELRHLKMRINRIVEGIKLSPGALCSPVVWSESLNAVSNCINEWRNIVSFHRLVIYLNDATKSEDDVNKIKQVSLDVFMLAQQALQVGPLSGSKPAYFKRCGSGVAKTAHTFLIKSFSGDVIQQLLFTERQRDTVMKWTREAERASIQDQDPSKSSNLKQSQTATGVKTKKIFKG